ncbi:MAG: KpsF/GutQ family sugar-phosphate isomerase [bacterium]
MLDVARRALEIEGNAVLALREHIGESFIRTINAVLASRGRVVMTGMGKSGHIAGKIAASLSSTGTPSVFLHPAEGFHGDLGIITKDDIVIAISNSGETAELLDLLPSIKKIGATVVCITGNRKSRLAATCDIVLFTGEIQEADSNNLVPTTSTTVALALGDALTVALMVKRDFRPEHFAVLHPKGMLAKRLTLKVSDLLRGEETNPVLGEDAGFDEALKTITKHVLGGVSIVGSDGRLTGIITDGDVRRIIERWEGSFTELRSKRVGDLMTKNPKRIEDCALAHAALEKMENNKPRPIFVLPVVDSQDRPVGLLHLHALVQAGFKASNGDR